MAGRVERQPDGWYDVEREIVLPLLADLYRAGGFADSFRVTLRRIEDLERRGA